MKEIIEQLEDIIKEQLKQCQDNKKVPSKEVLDTIETLNKLYIS